MILCPWLLRLKRIAFKKDATKYAAEMGISLKLTCPDPEVYNEVGEKIKVEVVGMEWRKKEQSTGKREQEIRDQHWQGKFFKERWADEDLVNCFSWIHK